MSFQARPDARDRVILPKRATGKGIPRQNEWIDRDGRQSVCQKQTQFRKLEETSASLEGLSSMTGQNAAHAQEANHLSKESLKHLVNANKSMKTLIRAIEDI